MLKNTVFIIFACLIGSNDFANAAIRPLYARVMSFYNAPTHKQASISDCVLFLESDEEVKIGLVLDPQTCASRKSEMEYLFNVTKNISLDRKGFQLIKDEGTLERLREVDAEAIYAKLSSEAKFKSEGPLQAKVVAVDESVSPIYNGTDEAEYVFGSNTVCLVYLNVNDPYAKGKVSLLAIVVDQSRCAKESLTSLKGKDVFFSRYSFELLRSKKMITALKSINRDYFYKALRDRSPGFKLK